MVIFKLFIIYYYINYRIISIREIYYFYKSSLYRDIADISLAFTKFITFTSLGLLNPSVSFLNTRLLYRLFIIISNTTFIVYSFTFKLADN
jgi:hypothetical protein